MIDNINEAELCRGRYKGGWACAIAGTRGWGIRNRVEVKKLRRCRNLTRFWAGLRKLQHKTIRVRARGYLIQLLEQPKIPRAVSQSLANAVYQTKHNGNGDNRFAIIIQGSDGDKKTTDTLETFEIDQFKANVQEIARILTEHPYNLKPGPGYTGYYLQDHLFYAGTKSDIPEINLDYKIRRPNTGNIRVDRISSCKSLIEQKTYNRLATLADSYDNVIFYYTSHGGYHTSGGTNTYLFDANDHHGQGFSWPYPSMNEKYSTQGDYSSSDLDTLLDKIICQKMFIIFQPCYATNFVNTISDEKNEEHRIIITSERKNSLSIFDKCNMYEDDLFDGEELIELDIYYVGDYEEEGKTKYYPDNSYPKIDGEEYEDDDDNSKYYRVKYYNEYLLEVDIATSGDFDTDYYENWKDNGAEFVSGISEAFCIDRFTGSNIQSNERLDADESITNGDYEGDSGEGANTNNGNSNDYVSCKEAFDYMKLWHLGYRLNKKANEDPWYDLPKFFYTNLELGNNYLF